MARPNFMLYTREDGSAFLVGEALGVFIVVGHADHWATREQAVAAGHALTAPLEGPAYEQMTFDLSA